ncbi:MAG: DUF1156 domain-containing protein [Deltaproteobacteria bacterium]|nr:DUF1156 domain-containing protein [Deltaproteobacteria bacterium]
MTEIKSPKKLIEVALPLDAINEASAREKSIRHGHPSTLHLWWARRPLATARAVIFSQMVNDPGWDNKLKRGLKKKEAAVERERLFEIIKKLVLWENTNNQEVLNEARAEIKKIWRETCELNKDHPQAKELFNPEKLPAFHDPFAGGGAIPLEAQRLGLESYASDLNPVAVTINKAMIEIPPKFAGRPPVGPIPVGASPRGRPKNDQNLFEEWSGAKGLAEDVRRYGAWMRTEAEKKIGHLYPKIEVTEEMAKERTDLKPLVGKKLTVIAWLWARTVKSPNPAYSHVDVPLVSTFVLSSKFGKEAFVLPVIEGDSYRFTVKTGTPPESVHGGTTAGKRGGFLCLLSGSPMDYPYIRTEGTAGKMGQRLMAIVAEGVRGRIYLPPTTEAESIACSAKPDWRPETKLHGKCRVNVSNYGFDVYGDLFTNRQLVALTTFSDLVQEAITKIKQDAIKAGLADDGVGLDDVGTGAMAYAQAVGVYLAFAIDRLAMTGNILVRWNGVGEKAQHCFGRQALPMLWDFAEPNFLADATGSLSSAIFYSYDPLSWLPSTVLGNAHQSDAQTQNISIGKIISTDPPYYDNICYADLSDFFYTWLRKSLKLTFPNLFLTLAVPKEEELVANSSRHGGKQAAETFFLDGMTRAIHNVVNQSHPVFPVTIYYAFKQSETEKNTDTTNTGWDTFLEAVLRVGFSISGTWPMRTEMKTRQIAMGTNALASSIILVCRKRATNAPNTSRREFIRELNSVLPEALLDMISGAVNSPVAPVDLSQAIIGPGMAIFSKYSAVLEADGSPMSVKTALQLINRFMAEDDFDHDTQFCLHWFESVGWAEGKFGEADVLARAKGTSVEGVKEAGVLDAGSGKVRLLKFNEYPQDWNPAKDQRSPIWEALHHMIRMFQSGGESAAGSLLAQMPARAENMRQLAYHLMDTD